MSSTIRVQGARVHNLKNLSVELPRDQLVVFTGLSGSGKSSLAFDTIYAEGQRRYVESLSAYARQFLGQMDKPDVDFIEGLSPAISIDQKTASRNPRSTVGTITEIHDYLRLLYARIGIPHCPNCGKPVTRQTPQQIVDQILAQPSGAKFLVLATVVEGRKGEYSTLLNELAGQGFSRVRVDGTVVELAEREDVNLARYEQHTIDVVLDRLTVKASNRQRLTESVETALKLTKGVVSFLFTDTDELVQFSEKLACVDCGISFTELAPRDFSFNSPYGACPVCTGLGTRFEVDPELVVPDTALSLSEGALAPWAGARFKYFERLIAGIAELGGFSVDTPWKKLRAKDRKLVLYGVEKRSVPVRYRNRYGRVRTYETSYAGIVEWLERKRNEADGDWSREQAEQFMREVECTTCRGQRLKPEVLAVKVGDRNIADVSSLTIDETVALFRSLTLSAREESIARQVIKEILERLNFLMDVGLDYLTLSRASATLSGGEAQRIRLASQIGSYLVGVLYVLDEPSIGLHQRDNRRLIATLERLRDLGNSVIVVEHDEETIRLADFIVDIGPGAGEFGGRVVHAGSYEALIANPESLTGQYLSGRRSIAVPTARRAGDGHRLTVEGARANNLQDVTVSFPLGRLRRGDRGVGVGQVHPGQRDPAQRPGAPGQRRQSGGRRARRDRWAWTTSTRSSRWTSSRSGAPRARTPRPTRGSSTRSVGSSPRSPSPRSADTSRAASPSTSRAGAARPAPATGRSRSRCTSCPTSTSTARSARARATTARPSRSSTGASPSPTCSTCRSPRPSSSSTASRRSCAT